MRIDLDLRRLRLFTEVVRQQGFAKAGRAAHASQSTISKAVKQLEQELGVALFSRVGRRPQLTPEGKLVYDQAVQLLAGGGQLLQELDELRGLKRGTLRIGFPRLGTMSTFAAAYWDYRQRYPLVEVELVVQGPARLHHMLREGLLDMAVTPHPVPLDFEHRDLRLEPMVALLPKTRGAPRGETVSLASLADFPLILGEEDTDTERAIIESFTKRGYSPRVALRTSQVELVFELVALGAGIAFLPRVVAERRPHRSVRMAQVDAPGWKWRVALVHRRGASLSPAARAWADLLCEEAGRRR